MPIHDMIDGTIFLNSDFLVNNGNATTRMNPTNRMKENPPASIAALSKARNPQTAQNRKEGGFLPPAGDGGGTPAYCGVGGGGWYGAGCCGRLAAGTVCPHEAQKAAPELRGPPQLGQNLLV
jgi:hypothetical protein